MSITPASSTSSTNRTVTAEGDIITLRGQIRDNQLQYEAQLKVINEGGTITANDDGTISIDGADSVTLILACGTDYLNDWPKYRGEDPHEAISTRPTLRIIRSSSPELTSTWARNSPTSRPTN